MSATRRIFFQLATLVLIAVTMYQAWIYERFEEPKEEPSSSAGESMIAEYEEKIFSFQCRVILGIMDFLQEQRRANPDQQETIDEVLRGVHEAMGGTVSAAGEAEPSLTAGRTPSEALLVKQLILSAHLELKQPSERICAQLQERETTLPETTVVMQRLCSGETPRDAADYTTEEKELLKTKLGWFGDLLLLTTLSEGEERDALRETVYQPARAALGSFAKGAFVAIMLFATSAVLCTITLGKLLLGSFRSRYRDAGIDSHLSLEIFCLYLAGMLLLGQTIKLLASYNIKPNILMMNIGGVLSLTLLILWPLLFGASFAAIRERLGLITGGIKRFFADGIVGPSAYLASIVPVFIVLIAYSALLSKLDIPPGKGAHPIVPILTKSQDGITLMLVVITAVVVAPIVEEIMFRGALYSWLRARMGATASILVSSMLFASLHPQGAVGLVPLTCIGIVLAVLREWRGTLIAPMAAHACFNAGTLYMVLLLFR